VLAPLPRRATPGDEIDTNPSTTPAWNASSHADSTVRASRPELMRTLPNPMPTRGATEEQVPAVSPPPTGGFGFLKVLTVLLVLASLGLGAYYYYFHVRIAPPDEPFVPPPNAPVPGKVGATEADADPAALHAQRVSEQDAREAEKDEQEGDSHHKGGNLEAAASAYQRAWRRDPRPVLALKLFSVLRVSHPEQALAWYQRYVAQVPGTQVQGLFKDEVQGLASASAN
jgi:serine/threonine-protein kinase